MYLSSFSYYCNKLEEFGIRILLMLGTDGLIEQVLHTLIERHLVDKPTHRKTWNYFNWYHFYNFLHDQFLFIQCIGIHQVKYSCEWNWEHSTALFYVNVVQLVDQVDEMDQRGFIVLHTFGEMNVILFIIPEDPKDSTERTFHMKSESL